MTVYYSLTFLLLAAEMATFCFLVSPLPHVVRKRLFTFLSKSPIIAKVVYGLKISFIFVAILFVDALQRMFRVSAESDLAKSGRQGAVQDVRTDTNIAARKFYAQRNMYLTGFTLFLSLVLTRTFYITLDLLNTQDEYAKLKKATVSQSRGTGAQAEETAKEIAGLRRQIEELESKERDFETLKKQASQNAKEYDELATEYNIKIGATSDKRKD